MNKGTSIFKGFRKSLAGAGSAPRAKRLCSTPFVMTTESHLRLALNEWLREKRPDLHAVASGNDLNAFLKELFISQGVGTFDVLIGVLKKARKKYLELHNPIVKRSRRRSSKQNTYTVRASKIYQGLKVKGERAHWNEIGYKVLDSPGKPEPRKSKHGQLYTLTWAKRVKNLESSVRSHLRREEIRAENLT
jgi:hypothetical protein